MKIHASTRRKLAGSSGIMDLVTVTLLVLTLSFVISKRDLVAGHSVGIVVFLFLFAVSSIAYLFQIQMASNLDKQFAERAENLIMALLAKGSVEINDIYKSGPIKYCHCPKSFCEAEYTHGRWSFICQAAIIMSIATLGIFLVVLWQ